MKANFLTYLVLILISVSCKTRKIETDKTSYKLTSTEILLKSYADFEKQPLKTIKLNSKIETLVSGNSMNFNAEMYIEPNQLIWLSLYYFGFSGGKALITPNEIKLYEKLNRTYIHEDFTSINKKVNIEGLNITFDDFQKIILGRLFFSPDAINYSYNLTSTQHELVNQNVLSANSSAKEKYIEKITFDLSFRPKEIYLKDSLGRTILIKYDQWQKIDDMEFPKEVNIRSLNDDKIQFHLTHKNAEIIKWNPPFEIPKNYKKRTL